MKNLISENITLPEKYTVSAEAIASRDLLLYMCRALKEVDSPESQAKAAECGRVLQAAIKEVHDARMSLSRPLVEHVDKLIQLERDYCAPMIAQKDEKGRLITAYQQAEKARVEAEEKQRQKQIEALAMMEKVNLEVAMKDNNKPDFTAEQIKAEMLANNAMEARQELIRAPLPALEKAKGAVTRKRLNFRVTDIHALYKARPDLCRVEPNRAAIVACCDMGMNIPGLDLWEEDRTHFVR